MTIADRKTPETDDLEIINEILWYGKNLAPMSERSDGKTWRESFNDLVGELVDFARRLERERDVAVEALEKLAPLGNGDKYGNSDGNRIAIDALRAIEESRK